ncbi:MAG: ribosome-binding factor A [Flavobacteriales bacterium]|jgi:ribosome-binding factor A|nr:ribosome-binding factor A [Flavobacteriales bacterium]|tara:strand:+ start:500 stop:841 length:342 start_codon:yes stop_codon:yes gene_type:complete
MESNRQKKVARLIQKDLSDIFLYKSKNDYPGVMISITHVVVSKDFSLAKVYLSLFPEKNKKIIFQEIKNKQSLIKHELSIKLKNQMRKTPELLFFLDNSHEHYETINNILKGI